jgi:acetyl-CoA carboxylase carboxyltransferase component
VALHRQLLKEYVDRFHNPYAAADAGQIDEVIEPDQTRLRLIMALETLRSKVAMNPPKKHGLMPV